MTAADESVDLPPRGPGSRRRRIAFFAIWAVVIVGALVVFRGVLLPFFLAIVVAYVLAPLVSLLERVPLGRLRMPRWTAVLALYVALLGALSLLVAAGVPRLAVEIEKLAADAPAAVATVRDEWIPALERDLRHAMNPYVDDGGPPATPPAPEPGVGEDGAPLPLDEDSFRVTPAGDGGYVVQLPRRGIVVSPEGEGWRIRGAVNRKAERGDITATITDAISRAMENTEQTAVTLLKTAQTVVRAIVKGIFTFSIMLMLSAYLLITSDKIFAFLRSLVRPTRQDDFNRLLTRIDRGLSGVVRGQLLICLVNGALSGIGFYIADLRYWPILTLIATVLSIIPIFGAIVSSIPAVIIGLQDGVGTALFVLAWIVGIHQIEANLLNPKIMGDAARVHPVLVVFALLAGEHLFGIAGALLAVPVLSVTQSLFLHFRETALGISPPAGRRAPLGGPPPEPATPTSSQE